MKMVFGLISSLIIVGLASATAHGQTSSASSTTDVGFGISDVVDDPGDQHNHDRAIAFGTVLLMPQAGDVQGWKAIEADYNCGSTSTSATNPSTSSPNTPTTPSRTAASTPHNPSPQPIPAPTPTHGAPADTLVCWSVLLTQAYQFIECPDGDAFVQRSGIGVQLTDRATGSLFGWVEDPSIGCTSLPTPPNAPTSAHRPLDAKHLLKHSL